METFSALLGLCAGNSPVPGEFPAQRPVTRSFDAFFDLCLNKRLSKQSRGWWFETPSGSLWRHCNENMLHRILMLTTGVLFIFTLKTWPIYTDFEILTKLLVSQWLHQRSDGWISQKQLLECQGSAMFSYFKSECVFLKITQLLERLASLEHQVAYLVNAMIFRNRAVRNICRDYLHHSMHNILQFSDCALFVKGTLRRQGQ